MKSLKFIEHPWHIFKKNKEIYVMNTEEFLFKKINFSELQSFNKEQKDDLKRQSAREKGNQIIVEAQAIQNINLFITHKCNLNCIYCYEKPNHASFPIFKQMTSDTAFKAIDWLIRNSQDKQELSVNFFGGEPLLNFELIKKVVEYADFQQIIHNKSIKFSVTTNGLLLDKEKIIFFLKIILA